MERIYSDENDWTDKLIHLHREHRYRACKQELYTSLTDFEDHLRHFLNLIPVMKPIAIASDLTSSDDWLLPANFQPVLLPDEVLLRMMFCDLVNGGELHNLSK